jgi:hypothetical protein
MLRELFAVAHKRGKAKGVLTISFTYEVDATDDSVAILTNYKTKLPLPPRSRSQRWLTAGGNLSEKNPRQLELGVRAVAPPSAPPRDVPEEGRKTAPKGL